MVLAPPGYQEPAVASHLIFQEIVQIPQYLLKSVYLLFCSIVLEPMTRRKLLSLFFLLAIINGVIFYSRDRFHYVPYRNYAALYKECDAKCREEWMSDPVNSDGEVSEARELSANWLPSTPTPDLEKITRIASHLHQKFGSRYGHPPASLLNRSPLDQYKTLSTTTGDSLWCGIYVRMFSIFSCSQQVTTRIIDMNHETGTHAVSECYLPAQKKWVLVDPTFGLLAVKNEEGELLDLQAFRNELRQNRQLYVLSGPGDSLQFRPLDTTAGYLNRYYKPATSTDYYYQHISLEQAYDPLQKIRRYIFPVSWYRIYDPGNKTNLPFTVKLLFLFSWILVTVIVLVQSLLRYNSKSSHSHR